MFFGNPFSVATDSNDGVDVDVDLNVDVEEQAEPRIEGINQVSPLSNCMRALRQGGFFVAASAASAVIGSAVLNDPTQDHLSLTEAATAGAIGGAALCMIYAALMKLSNSHAFGRVAGGMVLETASVVLGAAIHHASDVGLEEHAIAGAVGAAVVTAGAEVAGYVFCR